ncbi:MAG: SMI1/KNR4 family protein [Cyanobacteria bacterium P01_B01_bin.77]
MVDSSQLVATLKTHGVQFSDGLSERETVAVEELFGFTFPVDLRAFLQTALPTGKHFPNWRACDVMYLTDWLDLPREGVLFDVAYNGFWLREWGERPTDLADANAIVNKLLDDAPKLIPIYMHRMMPSEPSDAGNPVFSVHQTDIIVCGVDLADYFAHEFTFTEEQMAGWTVPDNVRRIRFWDVDRFQNTRRSDDGSCMFDNSRGILP